MLSWLKAAFRKRCLFIAIPRWSAVVQLLLDYSDSMTPFWEDLSALIDQIENLIGKERVNIYEFDQNPNLSKHCISSNKSELWRHERGRPILVASNLGIIGQPRRISIGPAWRTFIDACRKNNLPLLILVPWSKGYWPSGLGPHPLLIPWSPRTTAAMVYRLVGKGHKVDL